MKKILFLDIDGVLNSVRYFKSISNSSYSSKLNHFDPNAVILLNRIIRETNCKIVVSSSWRYFEECDSILFLSGVRGDIIGHTPMNIDRHSSKIYKPMKRGEEIHQWLENNEWDKYLILDDDPDMEEYQKERFIQTDPNLGLTGCDTYLAIEMMK